MQPLKHIHNDSLLCKHGGLLFRPQTIGADEDSDKCVIFFKLVNKFTLPVRQQWSHVSPVGTNFANSDCIHCTRNFPEPAICVYSGTSLLRSLTGLDGHN